MQTTTQQPTAAQLELFITNFYSNIEAKHFDQVAATIDPEVQQLDERSGTWVRNHAALIEGYIEEVASAERYRNWIEDVDTRMLGDHIGLATFVWHADAAWAGTDYRIRCPSTIVARWALAEGWRIVLMHSVPAEDKSAA